MRLSAFGAYLGLVAGCASVGVVVDSDQSDAHRPTIHQEHTPQHPAPAANGYRPPLSHAAASPKESPADVWDRIRAGLALPGYQHQRTLAAVNLLEGNQYYLDQIAERGTRYLYYVVEAVEQRQLPMELALLPIIESSLQPFAYSHARASGLWQFISSTAQIYQLKQNWWYDGRRDIVESTRAALDYLQQLHGLFGDDWLLALAAYNAGQGSVRRAIEANHRQGKPGDYWSLQLPTETRNYVPKLLALATVIADPERHSLTLRSVINRPYFERVTLDGQIDLALAAEFAGISLEELYMLNPGFNQWATDPDGPHHLLLPMGTTDDFTQGVAALPAKQRVKWQRHRVRRGHTLSGIARRYETTVAVLKQVNDLTDSLIRTGDSLVVPVAARSLEQYTLSASGRRNLMPHVASQRATERVYAVKKGDTLWRIARHHNVSTRDLAKWNGIALSDHLRPGQKLNIWLRPDQSRSPTTQLAAVTYGPSVTGKTTRRIRYVVRRGDSLWDISRRFRVTVPSLREWNRITEDGHIKPGQPLDVFIDVTQQLENT